MVSDAFVVVVINVMMVTPMYFVYSANGSCVVLKACWFVVIQHFGAFGCCRWFIFKFCSLCRFTGTRLLYLFVLLFLLKLFIGSMLQLSVIQSNR